MAIGCLYCGLQLPDTAEFCPECGRLIERGFEIRPIQESEFDGLRKEMKGKDDLLRQKEFYYEFSGPHAHMEEDAYPGNCPKSGARLAKGDRTCPMSPTQRCARAELGQPSRTGPGGSAARRRSRENRLTATQTEYGPT